MLDSKTSVKSQMSITSTFFSSSQQAQEQKVQRFRENHAAKKIQNEWLGYRHRRHEEDVDDVSTLA